MIDGSCEAIHHCSRTKGEIKNVILPLNYH
jgi:hypothetical protein